VFKLAGIELNPATRALIGALLLIVGVARHGVPLMIIGGVCVAWGIVGLVATLFER
jgi:energy-coupling factor transporter transmembrane protein EcfT